MPVPTDIHFGCGILRTLPERLKSLGATKTLIVTDPGVRAAGILDRVTATLQEAACIFTVWDRVKPDSGSALIDETVAEFQRHACDAVVGLGGGSARDYLPSKRNTEIVIS